ncbi:glycoside hydrolase family 26 protein [Paenarthrobacter nitroguajacolicus]|uniref:glycoside hydrolase family 26 protein n=1 Tax=Paenarthrobacter nitroguajacolicus TaxID=211146 RepID=UPI0040541531
MTWGLRKFGAVITAGALLPGLVGGCAGPQPGASTAPLPTCEPTRPLAPKDGILAGVNLDWEHETLEQYAADLGKRPAVTVTFTDFPMSDTDKRNVDAAFEQIRANGGTMLLTLEPKQGLAAVTTEVAEELATALARYNNAGVPVIVRFAHEMNGSWYAWGQQPAAYVAAYQRMADAVHSKAAGSAMMWAPNYGGGYPFSGGQYEAVAGSPDFATLDTDKDGAITGIDDPYAPYYPGDDAVDWVGMSLYHWGNTYPWGANVIPEPGKFRQQLTGTYNGAGGNDLAVPDFYAEYGTARNKPVAIPETAALTVASGEGADALAIKEAWWGQLFDPAIPRDYPALKMINWFEWDKNEVEVKATVDWTATKESQVREAYTAALPDWFTFAEAPTQCSPAESPS